MRGDGVSTCEEGGLAEGGFADWRCVSWVLEGREGRTRTDVDVDFLEFFLEVGEVGQGTLDRFLVDWLVFFRHCCGGIDEVVEVEMEAWWWFGVRRGFEHGVPRRPGFWWVRVGVSAITVPVCKDSGIQGEGFYSTTIRHL